jgi:hypothetical protein
LEKPTAGRQITLLAAIAAACLIRAQAVVFFVDFPVAIILLAALERGRTGLSRAVRTAVPTLACLAAAVVGELALTLGSGRSPLALLGTYRVIVTSASPLSAVRWGLGSLADLELYVGVIPFAAFALLAALLFTRELGRDAVIFLVASGTIVLSVVASVAALSATPYGLGRIHERNLFAVAPLLFIALAILRRHSPTVTRRRVLRVAIVAFLLPLAIPASGIATRNVDSFALFWWTTLGLRAPVANIVIATLCGCVTLWLLVEPARRRVIAVTAVIVGITLLAGLEQAGLDTVTYERTGQRADWIDRAVPGQSRVMAVWYPPAEAGDSSKRVHDLWMNEFFNRRVTRIGSTAGRLPDGLPVVNLRVQGRCLSAVPPAERPEYLVVPSTMRLDAPVVARSAGTRSTLYHVAATEPGAPCLALRS